MSDLAHLKIWDDPAIRDALSGCQTSNLGPADARWR